jgi:hypothetical protein
MIVNPARRISLAMAAWILCAAPLAVFAQQIPSAVPAQTSGAEDKPLAFD